ncbi:sodium-coupled monocarboxylate transporter 1-like isoform X2 [Procambarus clarkii]|uniref:sodium-coupled monocarboxylate transporter 1-like isoform X2 n=1 Tax=Procambarus clarkii TaxID=6728 RepID=UPI00374433B3
MSSEELVTTAEDGDLSGPTFTTVDYTVFSLMLAASVGIGVYSALKGRGNTTSEDYLLGGRTMSPVPVAFSLLGGVISAIAILGNSSEVYAFGTQICTSVLGIILGCLFVHQVSLPVLFNLKLVSINKMASGAYLLYGLLVIGMVLYAPSLALTTVIGLSTTVSVVAMGMICTFYITIGGVKAVVYTDVLQTSLMFLGVLVVVVICTLDLGGVGVVWDSALQGSRVQFLNLDPSPFIRHTFWSTIMMGLHHVLYLFAFSQVSFQRLVSVSNVQTSKRLCLVFAVGLSLLYLLYFFSGMVAYAVYRDCDPFSSGKINKFDQILPFMVIDKLNHLTGLSGIFVVAVYGGVLSSVSSAANSVACLLWEDFLKERSCFRDLSNEGATKALKIISLGAGVIGTCMGLLVGQLGGVLKVAINISGVTTGPINGLYIAGMCTPWVNTKGAVVGSLTAFIFSAWILVGNYLYGGGEAGVLPLSTAGCPEAPAPPYDTVYLSNTSETGTLLYDTLVISTLAEPSPTASVHGSPKYSLYDISYSYTGVMTIFITLVISNVVSFCTGPLSPSSLAEGVVNPTCGRLHKWLWKIFRGPETAASDSHESKGGKDKLEILTLVE